MKKEAQNFQVNVTKADGRVNIEFKDVDGAMVAHLDLEETKRLRDLLTRLLP